MAEDATATAKLPGRLAYRADIDGLRGLAVLAVVAYHAGVPFTPGGFVGVDVFFVISGYLIAGLINAEQSAGSFSTWNFYERRVRRIMPALLVVLTATVIISALFMAPFDLRVLALSALFTLVSVSNFYFQFHADYFSAPDTSWQLLHTWSLGVEEQFYLAFPIFMLLAARFFPRWRSAILGAVAVASLALSAWMVREHPSFTFYLPFTRAWELLAGVLLALNARRLNLHAGLRQILGLGGLALVGASIVLLNAEAPFPGPLAIPACLGTALILAAGPSSLTNRALSWGPLRWVGLVSYSFYLWHWPLLRFYRQFGWGSGPWVTAGVIAVAFLLAVATWWLVEKPFRNRKLIKRRPMFVALGLGFISLAMVCVVLIISGGLPQRLSPEERKVADYVGKGFAAQFRSGACMLTPSDPFSRYQVDACFRHDPARPNWLLLGDSHAAHLWWGLSHAFTEVNLLQANVGGCGMTLSDAPNKWARKTCRDMAAYVYREIDQRPPDGIVYAARWTREGLPEVRDSLKWMREHKIPVVVVGPMPTYKDGLARLIILRMRTGNPDIVRRQVESLPFELEPELRKIAEEEGASYISPIELLCHERDCQTLTPSGAPFQNDPSHLTPEGSLYFAGIVRRQGLFPPLAP